MYPWLLFSFINGKRFHLNYLNVKVMKKLEFITIPKASSAFMKPKS